MFIYSSPIDRTGRLVPMTHPQRTSNATLDQLFEVTTRLIDHLIAAPPAGMHRKDYCGNTSNRVTGYRGVQAFLRRDGQRIRLQVTGPEALLQRVVDRYKTHSDLSLSQDYTPGSRTFEVNY